MDRAMIISGVEHCEIGDCFGCPYNRILESLDGKYYKWEPVCKEQLKKDIYVMFADEKGD